MLPYLQRCVRGLVNVEVVRLQAGLAWTVFLSFSGRAHLGALEGPVSVLPARVLWMLKKSASRLALAWTVMLSFLGRFEGPVSVLQTSVLCMSIHTETWLVEIRLSSSAMYSLMSGILPA